MEQRDFELTEMEDSWVCSTCKNNQPYEQMAMKQKDWEDILCPDCYFDL